VTRINGLCMVPVMMSSAADHRRRSGFLVWLGRLLPGFYPPVADCWCRRTDLHVLVPRAIGGLNLGDRASSPALPWTVIPARPLDSSQDRALLRHNRRVSFDTRPVPGPSTYLLASHRRVSFAISGVGGLYLLGISTFGPTPLGPAWVFTPSRCFAALIVMSTWYFLWRDVYEVEIRNDELLWRRLFQSGSRPLKDICEIRPCRWARAAEVIRFADGHKLRLMTGFCFMYFMRDIRGRLPGVPMKVSRLVKDHRMLDPAGI